MNSVALTWTQDLALKDYELNQSHRGLLDKLNSVISALSSGDETQVLMAFSALTAEAHAHFIEEEDLMREAAYPALAEHCAHHHQLLQGLAELRFTTSEAQNFPEGGGPLIFLEHWFVPHLTHDDKKLADFLAAKAPPSPLVAAN